MLPSKVNQLALGGLVFTSSVFAFFRLPCASPLIIERADPIVSPGEVSGHVHTVMGGNGFGFKMDYAATQASTCSSCTVIQDKSNYWVPTVYYKAQNGSFIDVTQTGGATIYYLQRNDPNDPNYPHIRAFPEGFRMVSGNPLLRSYTDTLEQRAISFVCLGSSDAATNGFPPYNCPEGLRTQVNFPSCWDGVNLDSADHKSHMAFPEGMDHGSCPVSHPHRLVSLFYEIIWNTPDFADMWYGNDQPFVLAQGDPTGFGFHGDFLNGWDVSVLQQAIDNCNDDSGVIENCPYFDLVTNNVADGCNVVHAVEEDIAGVLPALPGCNPVQYGPANAEPRSGCGAPTQIGPPQFPFVDLTATKKFGYVGCGLDLVGHSRTLQGASTNSDSMTVEECVDFCVSNGYSVAGIEFSTQCFCNNSIPTDRAPIAGLPRSCTMPCGGNSKEVCGGPGLLSLYQKCEDAVCQNIHPPYINGTSPA